MGVLMGNQDRIVKRFLHQQIAVEEGLYAEIQAQLASEAGTLFLDARNLLTQASEILRTHFLALNSMLDGIEGSVVSPPRDAIIMNGAGTVDSTEYREERRGMSELLREDYVALNRITMSNTLLHTTALALGSNEVAQLALTHIQNLVPIVVRLGELAPEVAVRELSAVPDHVRLSAAKAAIANVQLAWRTSSPRGEN